MNDDPYVIIIYFGIGSHRYRVSSRVSSMIMNDVRDGTYNSSWHNNLTNVVDDTFQRMTRNGRERTWYLLLKDPEILNIVCPAPDTKFSSPVLGSGTPVQMYHILLAHLRFMTTAE